MDELEKKIRKEMKPNNGQSLEYLNSQTQIEEPINFIYLHNPTKGKASDVWSALQHKANDGLVRWDDDLSGILESARQQLTTQKLLLVGHSEGNFYANNFYTIVVDQEKFIPQEAIGVYAIATSSNYVPGGGKHLTLTTDKIIAYLPDTQKTTPVDLTSKEFISHSFSEIYLKYKGKEIVQDIQWSLDRLKKDEPHHSRTEKACIDPFPEVSKKSATTIESALNNTVNLYRDWVKPAGLLGRIVVNVGVISTWNTTVYVTKKTLKTSVSFWEGAIVNLTVV